MMEEERKDESTTPEPKRDPAPVPSKEERAQESAPFDKGLVIEDEGMSMEQALGEAPEKKTPEGGAPEGRGRRGRGRRGRGRRGRGGAPEQRPQNGENRGEENRGGENRGGENRGGENRGGENRGGENRGGENRGGENRGGENRGGENRGGENRGDRGRNRGRDRDRGQNRNRDKGRDRGPGGRDHDRDRDAARRGRGSGERRQTEAQKGGFKREIYVNGSQEETRVAIMEDERLVELLWERKNSKSIVGDIYKGTVENVLPGISSAFINIGFDKNAYLYISDVLGDTRRPIDQILKKGQEVMIQVAKEAIGTKGAKVTMDVTLPGRYLVFTPFSQFVGISKHIANVAERKRISEIVDGIMETTLKGKGVVVRTEAEGATKDELEREAKFLMKTWEAIDKQYQETPAPCRLHEDLDVSLQVARDLLTDEVYVYLIDDKKAYENVVGFIDTLSPELKNRVRYYDGKTPIFTAFGIEPEIEKIRQTKCALPSGGSIVIQEAESLCAIDVNTGRFTGSKSQEETVTLNNVEAAQMVAQQLRLRNIGGIVVIDFIDMRKASNRQKVMEALAHAVKRDRAKIRILPITRLGLIEMTRERKRESTVSLMTDECPECMGSGRVLSAESLRIRIQREIIELTQGRPGGNIRLVLHPQLAEVFEAKQKGIEESVKRGIKIVGDANLQWEDYRIILE